MSDPLTAGEEAIGKLPRRQARMARDVLEPFHAVARSALQLQDLDTALLLVCSERALKLSCAGDVAREADSVLHGKLGAGTDGEVSRVRRIPDQCKLAVVPLPTQDAVKIEPRGKLQVCSVALQSVATKIASEELLAELNRTARVGAIKAMRLPGLLARLDDDGRHVGTELVGVDLEPAVFGFLECEGKGRELLRRTQPHESASAHVDIGFENGGIATAGGAVDSVSSNDEVSVPEFGVDFHFTLEALLDAKLCGALLQQRQQAHAADAAEPVPVAQELLAAQMNRDVVPMAQPRDDGRVRRRIGRLKILHGLVREYDAPAERVGRPISFVYLDASARQRLLQQNGCVKPCRATTYADNALHTQGMYLDLL